MNPENMLGDLLQIIERAATRSVNDESFKLVVLPLTEEEFRRWRDLTSWGDGN